MLYPTDNSYSLSYNHTVGTNFEYISNTHIDFVNKTANTQDSCHSFGYCLSKILECIPLYDTVDEKNIFLAGQDFFDKIKIILQDEHNNELYDLLAYFFKAECLKYTPGTNHEALKNIKNFVDLCCQDSKYCTLEALAFFSSLMVIPLKSPEKMVASDNQKPRFDRISVDEIQSFLDNIISSESVNVFNSYEICDLKDICFSSLYEIFSENRIIKKCDNCGKVFTPPNKTDTKYCTNISPQYSNLTCKEAMKYIKQQERLSSNDLERLHKVAYNTIRNRLNSKKASESDNIYTFYEKYLQDFKNESKDKRQMVLNGKMSKEAYIEWLDEAKRKRAL